MFELVHKRKRLAQVVLVLLVIPFAFFGLESYTRWGGGKDDVATVNGAGITQREFAEELRRQQDRLRAAFGPNVDPEALDTPDTRRALVESLVAQRLLADAARRAGLTVSDDALRQTIAAVPAFQAEGGFSRSNYEALLRAQGMTPQMFEERLRQDLMLQQLGEAVGGTALVSRAVSERLAALSGERREVREALVAAQPFAAQAKIGESQVKAYFDAHPEEFRLPERLRAEYVTLSAEALREREPVAEEAIRAAYDSRASQFAVAEQRRASHILVKTREEADRLAAEARKNLARFAELAKKHSQDPGSAAKGGDLGYFGKGMMVPPFEEAAFRQKEGEIGEPVQSDFGWHVIRVTGVQAAKVRPYAEVRAQLADELARQQAARRFAESAEAFSNIVYEQSDSLKPAAERFKLPLRTSGWLTRIATPEAGVLGHPKLLAALFSEDALKARRNTDAVEVSPSVLVAARVVEHVPQAQRKYEEVRAEIEARLRADEATGLAQRAGEAKLQALRKGEDAGLNWSAPKAVSRRSPQGIPAGALRPLLAAEAARLPVFAGAARGTEGYVLYRVDKVLEPEPRPEAQRSAERARAAQLAGARQMDAYIASLRASADVEIHAANFEKRP
ncbi:MAG: SurA N-terminal domain-containing protein [Betaproteobacteria bacterium]|nr:SurA N-terminal domain-containing protein [Betaproteobacteria bacterium]MDH5222875.1 SurA N-terminal domain-containing protein [Betaproteobacteria bacterium]MDH5350223.1 SurA N-terminal domain-containing protein [Betaproteobacteria bacterium]